MKKIIHYTSLLFIPLLMIGITPSYNNFAFAESDSITEILYSINVGDNRYFIHFNACAGEKSIVSPSIVLESELDTVHIKSTKIIYENSCQGFESIISTKSPQLVKISIVE